MSIFFLNAVVFPILVYHPRRPLKRKECQLGEKRTIERQIM